MIAVALLLRRGISISSVSRPCTATNSLENTEPQRAGDCPRRAEALAR